MPIDERFYAPVGEASLGDWATFLGARLVGDASRSVTGLASSATARAGDVCFHDGPPSGAGDIDPNACGCVLDEAGADHLPERVAGLIVDQPRLAHARAAAHFFRLRSLAGQAEAIHPDAQVHAQARLGPGVVVGPGAAIGEDSEIGALSVIGPGVQIGRGARIGANVSIQCGLIGDHVSLSAGVRIGEAGFGVNSADGGLVDQPHFGRVILQDHVSIGANSAVDRGAFEDTVIGERTKIDNLCQIAHNVRIGRNVVIAAFGGISGSVEIGDWAQLGGQAGVADHTRIGKGASLAAAGGVFRDIPDGETWGGFPARPIKQWMIETAWLQKQVRDRKKS